MTDLSDIAEQRTYRLLIFGIVMIALPGLGLAWDCNVRGNREDAEVWKACLEHHGPADCKVSLGGQGGL